MAEPPTPTRSLVGISNLFRDREGCRDVTVQAMNMLLNIVKRGHEIVDSDGRIEMCKKIRAPPRRSRSNWNLAASGPPPPSPSSSIIQGRSSSARSSSAEPSPSASGREARLECRNAAKAVNPPATQAPHPEVDPNANANPLDQDPRVGHL